MYIAIVGAPGTGSEQLTTALGSTLPGTGITCVVQLHNTTSLDVLLRQAPHPPPFILLTGLDWPLAPDDDGTCRAQDDAQLRQTLDRQARGYAVVYGKTIERRCSSALQMVMHLVTEPTKRNASRGTSWKWNCEKCSDAQCEHQLFSALVRADSV